MNEFVLVEFLTTTGDYKKLMEKLDQLGEDFQLKSDPEDTHVQAFWSHDGWISVTGRINSVYASVIKLQDSFLAERMRISYISDDLKNKYRK